MMRNRLSVVVGLVWSGGLMSGGLVWCGVVLGEAGDRRAIAQPTESPASDSAAAEDWPRESGNSGETGEPGGGDRVNPLLLAPVELQWLNVVEIPPDRNILTSAIVSATGLTPPSLWWTQQQVGGKMLRGWIAYPETEDHPAYVDLVVNRQLWGLSDYLDRYRFVHHFGQSAQSFGYSIRVFNDTGDYLALYPCLPRVQPSLAAGENCQLIFDSTGLGVVQEDSPFSNF